MEISLSFNDTDARLLEKCAAEQNMSVPDYVKSVVMKALAEEKERVERKAAGRAMFSILSNMEEAEHAERSAAILAMEKKESGLAGAGPAPTRTQPQGVLGFRTDDVKKEATKEEEKKECVRHAAWKTWLMRTFCVTQNGSSNEMLLAKAHQTFDEFLKLTAERLGLEKSQSRFFFLCENIPLIARKKILSVVNPHQLAVMLSGFASDDFKKDFQAMSSSYIGKSDEISPGLRDSCIALFSSAGSVAGGVRNAVVDAMDAFIIIIAPMIGKTNAVKVFMQLVQIIPKSERQKILLAMPPQDFSEMLIQFLF